MKGFVKLNKLTKEQLDKIKGGGGRPPKPKYGIYPLYGIEPLYGVEPLYGISPT